MMTTSPRVGQAFGAPRAEDDYIAFNAIDERVNSVHHDSN